MSCHRFMKPSPLMGVRMKGCPGSKSLQQRAWTGREACPYPKKAGPPGREPAGMLGMIGPQKLILAPSCTRRGARKELISPNVLTVMLVLAYPLGSTRLSVLKVSRRSCSFAFPSLRMLKFFIRLASRLLKPGPRTTPRPALPGRLAYCGTAAKQAVLKYRLAVEGRSEKAFGALALGSQIMSGRELATLEPSRPRPPGSRLEVVTVNGAPL